MEEMDPTPRFEIAQHRPLGKITPFRGRLDESENSMQWLRGFVYEMKGTHTSQRMVHGLPTEFQGWCRTLAQSSVSKDEAHLDATFISYYCSQFSQPASTRYYRAKRSEKKQIRDYLNRLNGYARSANIKFERSGREAKEHVKHFLETCGDRDLERQLTPMQLRDMRISDIQKVEKRVSNRSSSQSLSRCDDKRHTGSNSCFIGNTQRVLNEYSNDYSNDDPIDFYKGDEADQDAYDSDCGSRDEMQGEDTYSDQDERLVAAANDNERRSAANGHSRGGVTSVHKTTDNSQVDLVKVDFDLRFNMVRGSMITVVDAFSRYQVMVHALHVVDRIIPRTCRLYQQVHDFDKCEALDELTKILGTNVDKKNISPELKLVFGCPPTETGLVPTGQPQSADLVIDGKCLYAFPGKWEWPEDNNNNDENEKNVEFNGECGVCLDGSTLHEIKEDTTKTKW
ncbi:LOW QUALITY PROTEIN: hypothetical protein PHMEG_00025270 [Phytophthora megakarya]|uniref:Retrotransposon gag domain-containing protein n=1 Tax=Phytophthora megakarya TaxID=4795 RepID=A0A225VCF0_9STRA|nr:LOW QUALITY PROTEIN: hypothetical protein PHMEG_00025270 [Phytophthora megakarya]